MCIHAASIVLAAHRPGLSPELDHLRLGSNAAQSIAKTAESTVSVNSISGSTSVEATPALGADHLNPPGPDPASAKAQQLKALQTWAAVPPIAKTLGLAGGYVK
jgi:hypothetical protein